MSVLEHAEIDTLHYAPTLFPECFAPALFISGRKTDLPAQQHRIRIAPRKSIPQRAFLQDDRTTYNIHYHPQLEAVFQRMHERAFYIPPDNFVLGIITGHNARHVKKTPWHLCLSPPEHYLLYDSHTLRQAAPRHRYQGKKFLYRFIASVPNFCRCKYTRSARFLLAFSIQHQNKKATVVRLGLPIIRLAA